MFIARKDHVACSLNHLSTARVERLPQGQGQGEVLQESTREALDICAL